MEFKIVPYVRKQPGEKCQPLGFFFYVYEEDSEAALNTAAMTHVFIEGSEIVMEAYGDDGKLIGALSYFEAI